MTPVPPTPIDDDAAALAPQSVPPGLLVDTALDVVDGTDGLTSLREAIATANALPGADLVTFDPALAGSIIRLVQGTLPVTDTLILEGDLDGDGTRDITISGDTLGNDVVAGGTTFALLSSDPTSALSDGLDNDGDGGADGADPDGAETLMDDNVRILTATEGVDLTVSGLVLTGGRAVADETGLGGGAIAAQGEVVLSNARVFGNISLDRPGGGIAAGVLDADASSIGSNLTFGSGNSGGGASANVLTISNSEVRSNATRGEGSYGGGLAGLLLVVSDTEIFGNATAGEDAPGGGLWGGFSMIVTGSDISNNRTSGPDSAGGGIYMSAFSVTPLQLSNSWVVANQTSGDRAGGGGVAAAYANLMNVTISENRTYGDSARGGGLAVREGVLVNTTVAENSTSGQNAFGGGISALGRLEATQVTVTGNSVGGPITAGFAYGGGGGLQIGPGGSLSQNAAALGIEAILSNSLVLGNAVLDDLVPGWDEIGAGPDELAFRGANLVGATAAAFDASAGNPATGSGAGNVRNAIPDYVFRTLEQVDARTGGPSPVPTGVDGGVLEDNGGQVPTVALVGGDPGGMYPALGSADPGRPVNVSEAFFQADFNGDGDISDVFTTVADLRFDARGPFFSRDIQRPEEDNTPDLGAFELQVAPAFSIAPAQADRAEGTGGLTGFTFEITRSAKLDGPVTIDFAVLPGPGDAAGPEDFAIGAFPTGTASFADRQETALVTVDIEADTLAEADEGFLVEISNPAGDPMGGTVLDATAAATIRDDDGGLPVPATVSVSVPEPGLAEGDTGPSFFPVLVTATGATGPITAEISVAGAGPDPASADDFAGGAFPVRSVTLSPDVPEVAVLLEVAGDTAPEPDEAFEVVLADLGGNAMPGTVTASGTIRDDDTGTGPGGGTAYAISAAPAAGVPEGPAGSTTEAVFEVTRSDASGTGAVGYVVAGLGAAPAGPADFGGTLPSGRVEFADGVLSAEIRVPVTGDDEAEADEGFGVFLADPEGGRIEGGFGSAVILDDDPLTTVITLLGQGPTAPEGDAGTAPQTFVVERRGDPGAALDIGWSVTGRGAAPADAVDFAGGVLPSGTVSFAAGGRDVAVIEVPVAGDTAVEGDETYTLALSAPPGVTLARPSADGTILDDDRANGAPEPVPDLARAAIDAPAVLAPLANDRDPEGEPLALGRVGTPGNLDATPPGAQSVTVAGGTVTVTPEAGFEGAVSLAYEVSDGQGGLSVGRATAIFGEPAVDGGPTPQIRFGAAADAPVPKASGNYLGLGGGDTYVLSSAIDALRDISIFDDGGVIQLAEGLVLEDFIRVGATIRFVLGNGAQVTVGSADAYGYEISANATTPEASTAPPRDLDGLEAVLDAAFAGSGTGTVVIGPELDGL